MGNYWTEPLKDARAPQIDDVGTDADDGSDSSSDDVSNLIQSTHPDRIKLAGQNYNKIARMCHDSVLELYNQAKRIADTVGGDSLAGVFKTIGELQADLGRMNYAAQSVGNPLEWYGGEVLPWFQNNVPRTGSVGLDDSIGDFFGSDTNGHALARHHLRQLNGFMGETYNAMGDYIEQRSSAPQPGMTPPPGTPGLDLKTPGGGIPHTGGGIPDPYGSTPKLPGLDNPSLGNPGLDDPKLTNPGLDDPSKNPPGLGDPSKTDPSQNPNLPNPQTPNTPDLKTPDLNTPKTPDLPNSDLPKTNLSGLPNLAQPDLSKVNTGFPTTSNPTGQGMPIGTGTATQAGGGGLGVSGGGVRGGMPGTGMGMIPPMMGGQGNQDKNRDRTTRFPMVEDEAFETDDLGGPSVIA